MKPKWKLKYIYLKDNSLYFCQKTKRNIDFDSIHILTRGNTWYGKYGFIPYDSLKEEIDIENYVNYKLNSKLVNKIKIKCTNIKAIFEAKVLENKLNVK